MFEREINVMLVIKAHSVHTLIRRRSFSGRWAGLRPNLLSNLVLLFGETIKLEVPLLQAARASYKPPGQEEVVER